MTDSLYSLRLVSTILILCYIVSRGYKNQYSQVKLTVHFDRLIVLSQVGLYHPKFMLHCKQRIQESILTGKTDCLF